MITYTSNSQDYANDRINKDTERELFHAVMTKLWPNVDMTLRIDGTYWDFHDDDWKLWQAARTSFVSSESQKDNQKFVDITDMFNLEGITPLEGFDEILKHYETTFGRTPDLFMEKVMEETKERLVIWWSSHREEIRAALLLAKDNQVIPELPEMIIPAGWVAIDMKTYQEFKQLREAVYPGFVLALAAMTSILDSDEDEPNKIKWLTWIEDQVENLREGTIGEHIDLAIAALTQTSGVK